MKKHFNNKLIGMLILLLNLNFATLIYAEEPIEIPTQDQRIAVQLTEAEKVVALFEMRGFVEAFNGIFTALSENDYVKAATAARSAGMIVPRAISGKHPSIIAKLPLKMKMAGMFVHQNFDSLAEDLENKIPMDKIMDRMGKITAKCVWCHQTYRFMPQENEDNPSESVVDGS